MGDNAVMTTFSTPECFLQPVLRWDAKSKDWQLVEDYVFTWGNTKEGFIKKLHIPAGQDYDKASVPQLLWGIARPDGPWEAAALIHDMLYKHKGLLDKGWYQTWVAEKQEWKECGKWNRGEADEMLEYMGVLGGAPKAQAAQYKWAVKLYPPNWFKGF